jgi:hypothetical protein
MHKTRKGTCVFPHRNLLHIVPSNSPIVGCDPVGRPISRSMHGMDYPCSERGCPMAGTTHRVAPYGIEDEYNAVHMVGHHHKLITNVHVPSSRPVVHHPIQSTIRTVRPGGSPNFPIHARNGFFLFRERLSRGGGDPPGLPYGAFYKHNAMKVIAHHHKLITNACSFITTYCI